MSHTCINLMAALAFKPMRLASFVNGSFAWRSFHRAAEEDQRAEEEPV